MTDSLDRLVLVCANCLRASCWHGNFYCEKAKSTGVTKKTLRELLALNLEHQDYWREGFSAWHE